MTPLELPRPRLITRRRVIAGAGIGIAAGGVSAAYAVGVAPFAERVARYALTPPRWPPGLKVRIVALADLHICEPWTGVDRLTRIVTEANALDADVIVLLGDYVPSLRIGQFSQPVPATTWGPLLGRLRAPGGVHAVLGNHDWWEDPVAQRTRKGPCEAHRVLADAGIRVHENTAVRLTKRDASNALQSYWIAGLGDQWAFFRPRRAQADGRRYDGADDLGATVRALTDDAPAVLLVHEPDIFPLVPDRFAVTLAGHTHGGQVRLLGYAPIVPSRFGRRYVHGHIVEQHRSLIVSAGLGVSGLPVRFGAPPEIVVVDLG